jgi:hypothetical protein
MKKSLSVILVLAALLTGCAMLPTKDADFIRYNNYGISVDNVCYLEIPQEVDVFTIDGKVSLARVRQQNAQYIEAGHRSIVVRYARLGGGRYWYSEPMNISFDFEAGNCYTVDYIISGDNDNYTVDFSIKEIVDRAKRRQAEQALASFKGNLLELDTYLAFSKENPTYFEGTWVTSKGKILEFTGNEFKFSKSLGRNDFSGTFVFDKNTIIIDITTMQSSPNEGMSTLDYKREGNRLSISGKGVGLFIRTILDTYTLE